MGVMRPDIIRVYSEEERDSELFYWLNDRIRPDRGDFRRWEYPAALLAASDMRPIASRDSALFVGGQYDSLGLALAQKAEQDITVVDLADCAAWYAGSKAICVQSDAADFLRGRGETRWDYAFAISSIEHMGDRDGDCFRLMLDAASVVIVTVNWANPPGPKPWGMGYGTELAKERLGIDVWGHEMVMNKGELPDWPVLFGFRGN